MAYSSKVVNYIIKKVVNEVWHRDKAGRKRVHEQENYVLKEEVKGKLEEEKVEINTTKKFNPIKINEKSYIEPSKSFSRFSEDGQIKTLKDYLSVFFSKELLSSEKGNAYDCPKCQSKKSKAIREYFIYKPPKVFIVQLKRFSGSAFVLKKNSKRVEIPLKLSLDDFILYDCILCYTVDHEKNEDILEEVNKETTKRLGIYEYELYGIISHSGGMGGGHYISYIKTPERKWYHASDSHVSEVSERRVIESEGYIDRKSVV